MTTKTTLIWSIIIALIIGWAVGHYAGKDSSSDREESSTTQKVDSSKEVALYGNMRKLWVDHVIWTREYIIEAVNNSPAANTAATRLMKNQEDIGNAVTSYYGSGAGTELTTLLKEHISIAVEIVAAAKANDQAKLKDADARWKTNGIEIATLLSGANPNWPKATLENMMAMHLSTTTNELNAILNKQYNQSITAFDAVFDHMMAMSDALSAGIVKQFPERF